MSIPFVVRPRPDANESFIGYRIRIADANRLTSASQVPSMTTPATRRRDVEELDELLRLDAGTSARRWEVPPDKERAEAAVQVGKVTFSRGDLRPTSAQLCPECVTELGYCHAAWQLASFVACPRHARLMLSHCPSCTKAVSRHRSELLRCRSCGYDYREAPLARPVRSVSLKLAATLLRAVETGEGVPLQNAQPFSEKGLREGLRIVRTMANIVFGAKRRWLTVADQHSNEREQNLQAVLSLLEDWPNSWFAHMDERFRSSKLTSNHGLRSVFRRELDQLDGRSDAPAALRAAFAQWAEERFPAIRQSNGFARLFDSDRETEWLCVRAAAADIGVSEKTVRNLLVEGKLKGEVHVVGRKRRQRVSRGSLEAYAKRQSGKLTLSTVATYLGISRKTVSQLVRAGLLAAQPAGGQKIVLIALKDVEKLIDKVDASVVQKVRGDELGLTGILAMASHAWMGLEDLLKAIEHDQIRPTYFDRKEGLRSIRVAKVDLARILTSVPDPELPEDGLTLSETANLLNETMLNVKRLIAIDALQSLERRGQAVCVAVSECKRFQKQYVRMDELVKKYDVSLWMLRRRFSWAGVRWATVPRGQVAGYFERETAEAFVVERMLNTPRAKKSRAAGGAK